MDDVIIWRRATVKNIGRQWGPARELSVCLESGETGKALAYLPLVGDILAGDEVYVSAAAVKRGLGTGGYLFVIANLTRMPADPPPQPGHLVKARYTPLQYMVQGVDEQESEFHGILEDSDSIESMPVIAADLHSALPAVVQGARDKAAAHNMPQPKIAYIMTDGGALPAWFSRLAWSLKKNGAIIGTVSCGQAFGGDLEAVNIYSALLAAKHVWHADLAVVTQGPGNLGTGTRWGFSGTQIAAVLEAAYTLGGRPIAALRMSQADLRERHFGISHHTMTVLTRLVHTPCTVPFPTDCASLAANSRLEAKVRRQKEQLLGYPHLSRADIAVPDAFNRLAQCGYTLRTMGRTLQEDAISFIAAYAAGYCF